MPVTVEIPKEQWTGTIREVTLGATAAEGGTRTKTVTVGGQNTLPFLHFEGETPNPPRHRHRDPGRLPGRLVAGAARGLGRRASTTRQPGPKRPRSWVPT